MGRIQKQFAVGYGNAGELLQLYREIVPQAFIRGLEKIYRPNCRKRTYSSWLTLWLMIFKRLHPRQVLSVGVIEAGRVLSQKLSLDTSGFSQARQRMPSGFIRELVDRIIQELLRRTPGRGEVFILDGTTVTLQHTSSILKFFQRIGGSGGLSHWPKLLMVCAHELNTGIALRPQFGPMRGSKMRSEPALAGQLFKRIPAGSTILADRCYGIASVASSATRHGLKVILRLTNQRAKKLLGKPLPKKPRRIRCCWEGVEGDLIVVKLDFDRARLAKDSYLYLFTTTELMPSDCAELYFKRWSIETDLRTLKIELGLDHLSVKSPSMIRKELYIGMAAYSLIRAVMAEAATRKGLDPRQLSFIRCLDLIISSSWNSYSNLLEGLARCLINKRAEKRPPQPRFLIYRRRKFQTFIGSRAQAREKYLSLSS